jgi:hypothetical protein
LRYAEMYVSNIFRPFLFQDLGEAERLHGGSSSDPTIGKVLQVL